jgi:hypothetical protein
MLRRDSAGGGASDEDADMEEDDDLDDEGEDERGAWPQRTLWLITGVAACVPWHACSAQWSVPKRALSCWAVPEDSQQITELSSV